MMSSVAGLITPPALGPYSSSKHALEALSNALRLELFPFGIDVVLIEPGYIVTNLQNVAADLMAPYAAEIKSGPYAKIYAGASAGASSARGKSNATVEDCARVMLRAIGAPRPHARYGVTSLATLVKCAKRLLPDRAIDALLRKRYGIARE
jgi:NAD(P)-dependent dehydrogenase (short-subunit alcohol dehydrogenase family)